MILLAVFGNFLMMHLDSNLLICIFLFPSTKAQSADAIICVPNLVISKVARFVFCRELSSFEFSMSGCDFERLLA